MLAPLCTCCPPPFSQCTTRRHSLSAEPPWSCLQIGGDIHVIQEINIILVFFISGLVLKTDDLAAAMKHKLGLAFGLIR